MKKLKVAFVAGFMEGFSEEKLELFTEYQKEMEKMAKRMDFELINYTEVIKEVPQAIAAREDMDAKEVDFVLLFHPSYILGTLVYEILKTRAHIGLWAIEELRDVGPMPLAAMVSLEQNASMVGHNFLGKPKKFKWFFGEIDGKYETLFKEAISKFQEDYNKTIEKKIEEDKQKLTVDGIMGPMTINKIIELKNK